MKAALRVVPNAAYPGGVDSRTVIRLIKADGWYHIGTKGSHRHFKHPVKPGRTTVEHPRKDIPIKTLRSIERQSGVKLI